MAKKKASRRWAALPRSKAKNAYDLLDEVKVAILQEPARYNQSRWLANVKDPGERDGSPLPGCGTIGCVAGWVVVLHRPKLLTAAFGDMGEESLVPKMAARILGLDSENSRLFGGSALHSYHFGSDLPNSGTKDYAKLGVEHITAFQQANEKALKAKKLVPPGRAK